MTKPTVLLGFIGAALFTSIGVVHGVADLGLVRLALVGAALGAVSVIDLREHRIPNRIVLPAAVVCALLAGPATLRESLPALALVALLLVLAFVRPAAIGMGDVKGALLVALALGAAAASALLLGFVLASVAASVLVARRGRGALTAAMPLAPFLATGASIALALR
jgi:leader peptidase (prepilin peptidase) / N-methyltransferase